MTAADDRRLSDVEKKVARLSAIREETTRANERLMNVELPALRSEIAAIKTKHADDLQAVMAHQNKLTGGLAVLLTLISFLMKYL